MRLKMLSRWLFLSVGLLLVARSAVAQGPREVTALAIDPKAPTTIYAGTHSAQNWSGSTDGGVYKSTDAGMSWTLVNYGMGIVHIRALAIDPKNTATVYAGTRDRGVFKTTNGGQSWEPINEGLGSLLVQALAVDPVNTANIYAGTRDQGIFKSKDSGKSWEAMNTGLASLFVQTLAINPADPETIYAGTRAGSVWREGADFTTCRNECQVFSFNCQVCRNNRSELTADGVFKSVNGGESWTAINNGLTNRFISALVIDPSNPHIIHTSTDRAGVFRSTDAGQNWYGLTGRLNPYPIPWSDVRAMAIDPKNSASIFAGTWGGGVFKSADGGQSWKTASTGLAEGYIYPNALIVDPVNPETIYAGTTGHGVFNSNDGGLSWHATGF
jgi:photosystem II stability/assembly factor-like uncharacterized protein